MIRVLALIAISVLLLAGCDRRSAHTPEGPIIVTGSFDLSIYERKVLERKATQGDATAAFRLSEYHGFERGDVVAEELWLRRASALGHPTATYNLGVSAEANGDLPRAASLYERAGTLAKAAGDAHVAKLADDARVHLLSRPRALPLAK